MQNYARFPPQAVGRQRGPGPMVAPPAQNAHLAAQQAAQLAHQEAQKRELARRQSRKPVDKNLPDGIDDLVIGDAAKSYRDLRDLERRLDAVMMRKRLDIMDSRPSRYARRARTLRIWISNSVENQPWQQPELDSTTFDFASDSQATFRVKIEGRLLDENKDGLEEQDNSEDEAENTDGTAQGNGAAGKAAIAAPQPSKLSHFFKQITVEFDRPASLQPDQYTQVVWKKAQAFDRGNTTPESNFDSLEFERKGDENINITIKLLRDESRERFKFSKPLADLIGEQEGDRALALHGVYGYIKANNLQESERTQNINCDAQLKAIFKAETVFFPHIMEILSQQHLLHLEPITLNYTIRVDEAFHQKDGQPTFQPTIYDISVPVIAPVAPLPAHDTETLKTLVQLDDSLALTIQAIQHSKAKHAFLDSLSHDPANFVKRWTSSQRRDLAVILGESGRGNAEAGGVGEAWRTGDAWKENFDSGKKVREGVGMWLNIKDKEDERRAETARRQAAQQQAIAGGR